MRSAWGVLFHPEADATLVDAWLAEPEMAHEAKSALGPKALAELRNQAVRVEHELIARSTRASGAGREGGANR